MVVLQRNRRHTLRTCMRSSLIEQVTIPGHHPQSATAIVSILHSVVLWSRRASRKLPEGGSSVEDLPAEILQPKHARRLSRPRLRPGLMRQRGRRLQPRSPEQQLQPRRGRRQGPAVRTAAWAARQTDSAAAAAPWAAWAARRVRAACLRSRWLPRLIPVRSIPSEIQETIFGNQEIVNDLHNLTCQFGSGMAANHVLYHQFLSRPTFLRGHEKPVVLYQDHLTSIYL